jgi:putative addiction module killer protein
LAEMRNRDAKKRIVARIVRIQSGLLGDHRSLGDKVSEIKVDAGPGYRLYFTRRGDWVILLLCGGDKKTQDRDIRRAKEMAAALD